jgi:putative acetyltransferase
VPVRIRPEERGDGPAVRAVHDRAFGGPTEGRIVEALHAVAPRVSLVAVENAAVIGHILFTPVVVDAGTGTWTALGLAPMAVLPEHQRRGVGSTLVREGLHACRALRESVVLGHPHYYSRFGFRPTRPTRRSWSPSCRPARSPAGPDGSATARSSPRSPEALRRPALSTYPQLSTVCDSPHLTRAPVTRPLRCRYRSESARRGCAEARSIHVARRFDVARARRAWRNKLLTPSSQRTFIGASRRSPNVFFHHRSRRRNFMEVPRKPLAKSEGRKKLKTSGLVIQWRGTPSLDDWVAFIVNGTRSKRLILADHTSERRVKALLGRIEALSKREIERLAKG